MFVYIDLFYKCFIYSIVFIVLLWRYTCFDELIFYNTLENVSCLFVYAFLSYVYVIVFLVS